MLRFRATETTSRTRYGPADIRDCKIIEGIAFEEEKEEYVVGFRLGFSETSTGEIGLEVDRGRICVKVFDFFDGILRNYADRVSGPQMESDGKRISVKWSAIAKFNKDVSLEELRSRDAKISDKVVAEERHKAMEETKRKIGLEMP
jgi:hypothetical protein